MVITCATEGVTVQIDECVYTEGFETMILGFNSDEQCTSNQNADILTLSSSLDTCGFEKSTVGDEIIFQNTISVIQRIQSNGLQLSDDVSIQVQCSFRKE
jgi:hypothetical protein